MICNKPFLILYFRVCITSALIFNCLSLNILFIVVESLQDTFGIIGVSKYSPIRASICFLIRGINSTDVGCPIPKFSSRYLNCSLSLLQL